LCGQSSLKIARGFARGAALSDSEAMAAGWRCGRSPRAGVPQLMWYAEGVPLICPRAEEAPLGGASVDMWWCPTCVVEAGRVPMVGSQGFGGLVVWLGSVPANLVAAEPHHDMNEPSRRCEVEIRPQARPGRPAVRAMMPGAWVVSVAVPADATIGQQWHRLARTVRVRAGAYSHVSFEQGVPR